MTTGEKIAFDLLIKKDNVLVSKLVAAIDEALREAREEAHKELGGLLFHDLARRLISRISVAADKSQSDWSDIELSLERIIQKAEQLAAKEAALQNISGDNLCWISDPEQAKALPEAEFLESCRRYRQQIADERGEFTGGRTIAQLEEALRAAEEKAAALDWLEAQCPLSLTTLTDSYFSPPARYVEIEWGDAQAQGDTVLAAIQAARAKEQS